MCVCVCVCVRACGCVYAFEHLPNTHTHTHTHTNTHTHAHQWLDERMDATRKAAVIQHREEETRGAELDKEIAEESEESLLDYEDVGSEVRIVHTHKHTHSHTHNTHNTHNTHTHTTYVYIHRRMRAMKKTSYCWMTKRLSPVALAGLYILKSPLFRDFYIVNILGH
jgi:hypothetical protein